MASLLCSSIYYVQCVKMIFYGYNEFGRTWCCIEHKGDWYGLSVIEYMGILNPDYRPKKEENRHVFRSNSSTSSLAETQNNTESASKVLKYCILVNNSCQNTDISRRLVPRLRLNSDCEFWKPDSTKMTNGNHRTHVIATILLGESHCIHSESLSLCSAFPSTSSA